MSGSKTLAFHFDRFARTRLPLRPFDINHHFRKRRYFRNLGERHVEANQYSLFE